MKRILPISALFAVAFALESTANAAVTQVNDFDTSARNFYTPSTTDLINGLLPTTSTYNGQFEGGSGQASLPAFTDGSAGDGSATTNGQVLFDRDSPSWNAVYNLDLSASPGGYNITSIASISGHSDARVNQHFTLEYLPLGAAPDAYVSLGEFIYTPFAVGSPGGNFSARVTVQDTVPGTPIATGVSAIRFTAFPPATSVGTSAQGGSIYRELDVIGTAVPEPTSSGLILLGAVTMLGLRRRNR